MVISDHRRRGELSGSGDRCPAAVCGFTPRRSSARVVRLESWRAVVVGPPPLPWDLEGRPVGRVWRTGAALSRLLSAHEKLRAVMCIVVVKIGRASCRERV